jgi:hypothetical protein
MPSVGLVLRPFGEAIVRCVLGGLPTSEVRTILREHPGPAWFDVNIGDDWLVPLASRRTAPVTAA